jgi:Rrf2 family protein
MKLTKKGEYALRAMIALARARGQSMTINQIALRQEIPKKFLEQILLALKGAGLLTSRAGPRGGYELSVNPRDVTVGAILKAVEEPISLGTSGLDDISDGGIRTLIDDIRLYVRQKLETLTLASMASENTPEAQIEQLMYYI